MKLAIVGSRTFGNHGGIDFEWAFENIFRFVKKMKPEMIISGGADGIDLIAEEVADEQRIKFLEFLPANRVWTPNGYRERNILIADACTHLLCVRHNESNTHGSDFTASYAEKLVKPIFCYDWYGFEKTKMTWMLPDGLP